MRLRSHDRPDRRDRRPRAEGSFDAGEEMLTEIAAKFTEEQVPSELWDERASWSPATWTDPAGDFLLTLAHPYC